MAKNTNRDENEGQGPETHPAKNLKIQTLTFFPIRKVKIILTFLMKMRGTYIMIIVLLGLFAGGVTPRAFHLKRSYYFVLMEMGER